MTYDEFIQSKTINAPTVGIEVQSQDIHPALFEHQRDIVKWALKRGRAAIFAATGLGKALDSDTRVITPTGYKRIGNLCPGDLVIGSNGKPTEVLGVFPQGVRSAYRITFSDDSSVVSDDEHLWNVRTKNDKHHGRGWQTKTLREIRESGVGGPGKERYGRWFIPMVEPVEFVEQELPLHPYLLGCLIGDGHIKNKVVSIASADLDLIEYLREIVPLGIEVVKKRYSKYDYDFVRGGRLSGKQGGHYANPMNEILTELGLQGHGAESKFIPNCYKFAAADTRLLLLQGLMDTDGTVWDSRGNSVLEYTTVSPRLAEDFLFLVQSLGGKGRIRTKKTNGRPAYRITPAFPQEVIPFLLKRKVDAFKPRTKYMPSRSIRSIEYVGERDMTCIKVDAEDELFVVEGFIVTHNTIMQSEWARHIHRATGGNVLILAPLAVAAQTAREAHMIGLDIRLCESQSDVYPGVNITNYEKLHKFEPESFAGIVLDESSVLKSYTSATRNAIIEGFQRTPYRLACTATPAPNDYMELGNHSEFLGIMSRTEMLSMFFVHDGGDTSKWRLKGHARDDFWKWVASWGCMIRKPSDLGYDDGAYELPPLNVQDVVVETGKAPEGYLFAMEVQTLQERLAARRATIEERCKATVDLIDQRPHEKWLVWVDYNSEQDTLARLLGDRCVSIQGSTPDDKRIAMEREWREGDVSVMLTKSAIFGFGLNWQHCNNMIFAGLSDSFESQYQAIRRCYRFGQTKPVNVYMVTSDLEGAVAANVKRKEADFERMQDEMSVYTRDIVKENVTSAGKTQTVYAPKMSITIPNWLRGA